MIVPDLYSALIANDHELLNTVLADTQITYSEDILPVVKSVCEDINTLTFNRITDYAALTQFQQNTLLRVCARFLTFKYDNAELLSSTLKSYAISGVSMSFDDAAVLRVGGVIIPQEVFGLLRQTGLTCRVL